MSFLWKQKKNNTFKRYDNALGREKIRMKLNSQMKAMEILENQILQKIEIEIRYFKLSYNGRKFF